MFQWTSSTPQTESTAAAATKYFGLTGTTSQDIQLGLTFTVPFLSIPLTGINSILSGAGLGDILSGGLGLFSLETLGRTIIEKGPFE